MPNKPYKLYPRQFYSEGNRNTIMHPDQTVSEIKKAMEGNRLVDKEKINTYVQTGAQYAKAVAEKLAAEQPGYKHRLKGK